MYWITHYKPAKEQNFIRSTSAYMTSKYEPDLCFGKRQFNNTPSELNKAQIVKTN